MTIQSTIGRSIHARRLELGISQRELAEAIGYSSHSAVAKIEKGVVDLPLSKLALLARALDTTVEVLLSGLGEIQGMGMPPDSVPDVKGEGIPVVAIILAGGRSGRNGLSVPTQFAGVLGRPVVSYVLEAYERQDEIGSVYTVCLPDWEDTLYASATKAGLTKLKAIVPGGNSGLESIRAGVRRLIADGWPMNTVVVIQETARPLVDAASVSRLIATCMRQGSCAICESMSDYLAFRRTDSGSMEYVDRDLLWSLQSPDAHRLSTLLSMFEEAESRGVPLRENCCGMLLHELCWPLTFVEGARGNVKVTRREDLAVFASLLGRS